MKAKSVFLSALAYVFLATGVSAAPIQIKWGDALPKSFSYWPAMVAYKEAVEQKLPKGRIDFQLFGDGVLGDQKTLIESATMGAIQMFSTTTSAIQNIASEFQVFALPFIWPNPQVLSRFLVSEEGVYLLRIIEKRGLKVVSWSYQGYVGIQNNRREVRTPEDLKGLKIRVQQNPLMVDTMNAMGAMGVAMGSGELYSALQQNVINGISTTPQLLYSMKIQEVAKFYTPVMMHSSAGMLLANLKFWNSLPADIQKVMTDCGDVWGKANADYCLDDSKETSDRNILKLYQKAGVKVTEPDTEAFKKRTIPVVKKYREKINPEYVDKVLKRIGYKME